MTPGALDFAAFLERNQIAVAKAAEELGATRTVLYYWLRGTQRPRPEAREQIQIWTGGEVKADSWFTESEKVSIGKTRPFEPHSEPEHKPAA